MGLSKSIKDFSDDELVQYIALVQKHKNVDDYDHNMYLTALREFFIRGLDYVKPEPIVTGKQIGRAHV